MVEYGKRIDRVNLRSGKGRFCRRFSEKKLVVAIARVDKFGRVIIYKTRVYEVSRNVRV